MLGSILLQPQALARSQAREARDDLNDDVMAFVQRLLLSPQLAQALAPAALGAAEALGTRWLARWEPRMASIGPELLALLSPLIAPLQQLGSGAASDSPGALLRALADALGALQALPQALSPEGVRAGVQRVSALLTGTLGLSQDALHDDIRTTLADLRTRLHALHAELDAPSAATAHALACLLLRVEGLSSEMPRLGLDADRLAGVISAALASGGLDKLRERLACMVGKLQALLRAAADVADAAQAVPRQAPRGRAAKVAPARAATRGSPARATARAVPTATADEVPAVPARSEDGSFCWYASWLYAEKRQGFGYGILPGFPHDEVWLSKDRKCLVLRRATGADVVLSSSPTPCEWHQMPPFSGPLTGEPAERFSFGIFPNEFLEIWTRISATAVEGGKGLWHLIDMATGGREHGANIPLWLWYWGKAVSAGFGEPLPSRITREAGADLGAKFLFSPLPSWLAVLFGSIEGHHSDAAFKNQFTYWLTLLGSDALTAWDAHTWLTRFHDLVLSTFTLLNQKPEVSGEKLACNWQHGGPYSQLGSFLAMYVMVVTKSRDDYSFPFSFFDGKNAYQALWFLVLAPLFSTIGSAVGTLVSFALSRQLHGGLFAEQLGRGALRGLRDYHLLEYQYREGDSDGGRYNPKFDTNGNVISPARIDFGGYPPASASPYKLPYEKGKQLFAGQANMGAFSHMRFAGRPQIYAYDFAHDFGEEILCSRPGTVVDYFDWMPDDKNLSSAAGDRTELDAALVEASALTVVDATSGATVPVLIAGQSGNGGDPPTMANFVMVRHDTRDDVHDRSQSSAPVFTFSKYMHGRKDGVRDAFAQRGIQPHQIIGSTVQQGHLVMLAGDTGLSFHNHLHMEVLGSTANSQGTATVALGVGPPISMNSLTNFTLPFVFSEVKNILHTDGVPWHLNWYESDNVKVP